MNEIVKGTVKLANGETLGYRKRGKGPKVLMLVHGNMSTSKHWDTVMESMPDEYTTYAIDMRGFGMSSYNNRFDSLRELSEDLKLFVDEMGLKKFHLAGWSTGGGVAMYFTIDYPEYVDKLILVESVGIKGYPIFGKDFEGNPITEEKSYTKEAIANDTVKTIPVLNAYKNKDKDFLRAVWDATIYVSKKPEPERYDAYLDEILTQRNLVDIYYSLSHFNISDEHNGVEEGTGEVHKIEVPTLVIQGKEDLIVPKEDGVETAEAIGDNAQLALLEGGGHSPMTDDLDRFMDLILSFMG